MAPSSVRPAGSAPPASDHEYGGVPPVAASVCEYATPTDPAGRLVVVTSRGAGATATESSCVSVCVGVPPSVTFAVNGNEPAAVGVPDTTPDAGSRLKPGGSDPESSDQAYGGVPPVAASVCA